MKKITIKNTDLELSPMGMGCVNAGIKWDGGDAFRIFDAFLDMGEPFMTLPAYMPTGFLLKSAAVNVYLDSGFAKAGNVMTLFLSPKADIRI